MGTVGIKPPVFLYIFFNKGILGRVKNSNHKLYILKSAIVERTYKKYSRYKKTFEKTA